MVPQDPQVSVQQHPCLPLVTGLLLRWLHLRQPFSEWSREDKARLVWGCSQLLGLSHFLVNVHSDVLSAPWRPEEVVSSPVGLVGVVGIWSRTGLPWASWDGLEELFSRHRPLASQCPVFPSRSQGHIIVRCP